MAAFVTARLAAFVTARLAAARRVARPAAALLVAGLVVAPAGPASAQTGCLQVHSYATPWHTAPDRGGYLLSLTITNVCAEPVPGWELALGLAEGHTASQGWNAQWQLATDPVLATNPSWQPVLPPGGSITIGMLGTWTGGFAEPVSCTVNGSPCDPAAPNQPPQVSMTSPADGGSVLFPGSVTLAAEASDPDGAVDRVEFYLDDELVGTDDTAPYEIAVPLGIPFCGCTAYARAVDDGDPPLSTDSEAVDFFLVSVPPAPVMVSPTQLAIPAGSSETVLVVLTAPTTVSFETIVQGDPGITAAPESFTLDTSNWDTGQEVMISVAQGTPPGPATVLVSTFPNAVPVDVTVVSPGPVAATG